MLENEFNIDMFNAFTAKDKRIYLESIEKDGVSEIPQGTDVEIVLATKKPGEETYTTKYTTKIKLQKPTKVRLTYSSIRGPEEDNFYKLRSEDTIAMDKAMRERYPEKSLSEIDRELQPELDAEQRIRQRLLLLQNPELQAWYDQNKFSPESTQIQILFRGIKD